MRKEEFSGLAPCRFAVFRLRPGQELLGGIREALAALDVRAAFVAACAGSLSEAALRFAGRSETSRIRGTFEVVALSGTIDSAGEHLHMCVSDPEGETMGGHVMEGSVVRTTMELVIGVLPSLEFRREYCPLSTYEELTVRSLGSSGLENEKGEDGLS